MKKCYKCNVSINSNISKCPLCKSNIEDNANEESVFPIIPNLYMKHKLFYKCLLFISILSSVLCIIINYLVSDKISWACFVVAGIISFWITFVIGVKNRNNFMRLLFAEMILILIASIIWDYFTGWHFWSITFVLPFLCISYISTLFFLRIFLKNIFKDHIIYIYINCLIGLIPLYFIFKDFLSIKWPSIVCITISILAILALAIFNHKQMKNELERRLHI
ncbi:MAG: hypothetical protein E7174_02765 [Firmicutes bacterium]|nr:hypothetical protein [Bacillota bacterium]